MRRGLDHQRPGRLLLPLRLPGQPGRINDYPKIGVWPDGYYMHLQRVRTAASGRRSRSPSSAPRCSPASRRRWSSSAPWPAAPSARSRIQPSHCEGGTAPAGGRARHLHPVLGRRDLGRRRPGPDGYRLWEIRSSNSDRPGSSTFVALPQVNAGPSSTPSSATSTAPASRSPSPARSWTRVGQFTMYRAQYRNFGTHESIADQPLGRRHRQQPRRRALGRAARQRRRLGPPPDRHLSPRTARRTAGWARSPWTSRATSPWATASPSRTSPRHPLCHPRGRRTRWAPCGRRGDLVTGGGVAAAARSTAGATTRR